MRTRRVAVMTTLLAVMVGATTVGPSAGAVAAPSGTPAGVGRLPSAKVPLPPGTVTVSPTAQTPDRKPAGTNDADDAAFWIHPTDPAKSLILGTVKEAGLDVYRPDGALVQTVAAGGGRYNNVDLVHGVTLGPGPARDLAVVTDRKTDKLHIFAVNGALNPPVTEVTATGVPLLFGAAKPVKSKTAYGVAAWRNPAGAVEVFATQENTVNLARFTLTDAGGGKVSYQKTASYSFPTSFTVGGSTWTPCFNPSHPDWQAHAEGMVVDPATGTLWADQELVGVWKLTTDLTSPQLVHKLKRFGQTYSVSNGKCSVNAGSTSYGDSYLAGDVEGIGLYQAGTSANGYLIVSNQSASFFTVFDRDGGTYRGAFKVGSAGAIDAVDQTDGVAVTNLPLGPGFPSGMLITQDGKDTPEGGTNFKLTPWSTVAQALGLTIDTGGGRA